MERKSYVIPLEEELLKIDRAGSPEELVSIAMRALSKLPPGVEVGFLLEPKAVFEMSKEDVIEHEANLEAMGCCLGSRMGMFMFNHVPFEQRMLRLGCSQDDILDALFAPLVQSGKIHKFYFHGGHRDKDNVSLKAKHALASRLKKHPLELPAGKLNELKREMILLLQREKEAA